MPLYRTPPVPERVYEAVGAVSTGDTRHIPLHVWVGEWQGSLLGVMTDHCVDPALPATAAFRRLRHVSSVQHCLVHEDLPAITGLPGRRVDEVDGEMVTYAFSTTRIMVDASVASADVFTYRNLTFAVSSDPLAHTFVVFRPAGLTGWPELRTRERDPW
ncbi:hypothetical protein [Kineosporia succinea]|uniref:Uncharacterized protein n=1 Tax=Kineosporia succinea TaxID=84632 RepID=A0ABT9PBH3_9ACTN|nr:hypothetical protein [Kineosporia succinea]MDP9830059.1 hypothetical protein [Kineosporia succinea]